MPLLAVNYHYVGLNNDLNKSLHGLSTNEFLRQINFLRSHFDLITLNELAEIDFNDKNYCLITFDDGLLCHYEVVFQLMKEYDFPSVFFISTLPLTEKKATDTHKYQYLRTKLSPNDLANELSSFQINNKIKFDLKFLTETEIRKRYRYDNLQTAETKYIINYLLSKKQRSKFINYIFGKFVTSEEEFVKKWYLSEEQIKNMHLTSKCIGSHAYSHEPLAQMEQDRVKMELIRSKQTLEEITGSQIDCISYPLGNPGAVGKREGKISRDLGYKFGFTMEREWNTTKKDQTLLARIDCNDLLVVGKSPLFYLENNQLYRKDGTLSSRSLYVKE